MVVYVDLDDGEDDELHSMHEHNHVLNSNQLQQLRLDGMHLTHAITPRDGSNPLNVNRNSFSAALSCYPYAFHAISAHAA